jgi:hypothetical protein
LTQRGNSNGNRLLTDKVIAVPNLFNEHLAGNHAINAREERQDLQLLTAHTLNFVLPLQGTAHRVDQPPTEEIGMIQIAILNLSPFLVFAHAPLPDDSMRMLAAKH